MMNGTRGRFPIGILRAALCLLLTAAATSLCGSHAAGGSAAAADPVQTRSRETDATSMRGGETHTTIRRTHDHYELEMTAVGALEFTDDGADVKSISGGGRLLVKERRDGNLRALEVVSGADGGLRHSYFVQGHPRPFEQEARSWLARILPGLIRDSGLNAAARVRRILGERGVDGILREIALIESDGVKRIYFDELLRNRGLDEAAVGRIIRQSGQEIASDGEKGNLLIDHIGRLVGDATIVPGVFDAVDTINSDGERSRVLSALLKRDNPPRDTLLRLLKSAARISSDGEKANLLVMAARRAGDDPTVRAALYDAARTISSDAERERVISALAQRRAPQAGHS